MKPATVRGLGFWSTGYPSVGAWLERRPDESADRVKPALLDSRIGRYTSLVTRMAIETLVQAATQGSAEMSATATVFGSAYGEILTAFEQLDMIDEIGLPSPARFKNSVHNTASGHFSIATGNMGFSTSIAAGRRTFAMCLVEAATWIDLNGGSVIVAVADEELPPHLKGVGRYSSLSVAVMLSAGESPGLARIGNLREEPGACPPLDLPEGVRANPSAAGVGLLEAVARGRAGTVSLETGGGGWCVDVLG